MHITGILDAASAHHSSGTHSRQLSIFQQHFPIYQNMANAVTLLHEAHSTSRKVVRDLGFLRSNPGWIEHHHVSSHSRPEQMIGICF